MRNTDKMKQCSNLQKCTLLLIVSILLSSYVFGFTFQQTLSSDHTKGQAENHFISPTNHGPKSLQILSEEPTEESEEDDKTNKRFTSADIRIFIEYFILSTRCAQIESSEKNKQVHRTIVHLFTVYHAWKSHLI